MSVKVFIDGQEGTTGLKILERFKDRPDIELLKIPEEKRKDLSCRKELINASDFTFLCLPDAAAKEAVSLAESPGVRIIDASTAHRTAKGWDYGFPELSEEHRKRIAVSSHVAVPGCYAGGFISLIYPLVKYSIISPDYPVTCHALSGYSGAGKKAIAAYEADSRPTEYDSPRQYALSQCHKHLPEMQQITGLTFPPVFNPIVCDYFSGMVVSVPLIARLMKKRCSLSELLEIYREHYSGQPFVRVREENGKDVLPDSFLAANTLSGKNYLEIFVCGNDDRMTLCARLDNLGKGASGAAVQCLNIMMGIDETTGLL